MKDFKVRCVESSDEENGFKKNKVYEIKNGTLEDEEGYIWTCGISADIDSINKKFSTTCTVEAKFELILEPQQFTKDMLKTGMRVELRNGDKFVYFDNGKLKGFVQGIRSVYLDFYDDEFNCKRTGLEQSFDIMKVYDTPDSLIRIPCYYYSTKLLWQRPEIPKLTHKEIEQALGHEFEYVKE